jgi:hypothetical protein
MRNLIAAQERDDERRETRPFLLLLVLIGGLWGLKLMCDILGEQLGMTGLDTMKEVGIIMCYFIGLGVIIVLAKVFRRHLPDRLHFGIHLFGIVFALAMVFNQMIISRELTPYRKQFAAAANDGCRVTGVNGHELKCGDKLQPALDARDKWLKDHGALRFGAWEIRALGVRSEMFEPNLAAAYIAIPFSTFFSSSP